MDKEEESEGLTPSEIRRQPGRFRTFLQNLTTLFKNVLRYPYRRNFPNEGGVLTIHLNDGSTAKVIVPEKVDFDNGENDSSRRVCARVRPSSECLPIKQSSEQRLFSDVYEIKTEQFRSSDGFLLEFNTIRLAREHADVKVMCADDDNGKLFELPHDYSNVNASIKANIEEPRGRMTIYAVLYSSECDAAECIVEDITFEILINGPAVIRRCMCFTVEANLVSEKNLHRKNSRRTSRASDVNLVKDYLRIEQYQDLKMVFRIQGRASSDWDIEGNTCIKKRDLKSGSFHRTFPISYIGDQQEPTQSVNCILQITPVEEEAPVIIPFTVEEVAMPTSQGLKRSQSALTRAPREQNSKQNAVRRKSMINVPADWVEKGNDKYVSKAEKSSEYDITQHVKRLCEGLHYHRNSLRHRLADHGGFAEKWKEFARTLGITDSDISALTHDEPHRLREQMIQMLNKAEERNMRDTYLADVLNALISVDILDVIPIIVGEALLYTIAKDFAEAGINFKSVFQQPVEDVCTEEVSEASWASERAIDVYDFLKGEYQQTEHNMSFIHKLREILLDETRVAGISCAAEFEVKARESEELSKMLSTLRNQRSKK